MFYCVKSIYRAGGNVTRDVYVVHSPIKPDDTEKELEFYTVVNRYFNTEDEALDYIKKVSM